MNDRADNDQLPRFLLDRYRVEEVLGERGCRVMLRAFDLRTRRPVLVKALKRPAATAGPDPRRTFRERIEREVDASARIGFLSHVVPVLDLAEDDDGTTCLVLEYLSGGDLAARLGRGPLPTRQALRIAADVAEGLYAAHDASIVHCAVTPGNVFLTGQGRAKIGNFGAAQIEGEPRRTVMLGAFLNSPLYLSPEQEALLRPSTDQYSLGLVLFEMLAGRAYKAMPEQEASAVIAGQARPVAAVVRRMLERDPDDRFPTMCDVARAIATVMPLLDGLPESPGAAPQSAMINAPSLEDELAGSRPDATQSDVIMEHRAWQLIDELRADR